ncbi:hypothetical protein KIN20_025359 [Parelaphostrongylus tenuis]|uniref:Mos1 transposase HTH domain-containing protein n=1 Tax=Parelaphostrongylus tenuis TaxID=148309 RepID=A0AAD5MV74_PARTN|nr:hypothetical protein KIN20_025359 [Parelaphostrongylus tenuis]
MAKNTSYFPLEGVTEQYADIGVPNHTFLVTVFRYRFHRMDFGGGSSASLPSSLFGDGAGPKSKAEAGEKINRQLTDDVEVKIFFLIGYTYCVYDYRQIGLLMMHEWLLGSKATVASEGINVAWDEETVDKSTVYKWFEKFGEGEES